MPCYAPRTAYKTEHGISFNELSRDNHIGTIQLRCKQCIGCRLDTAREWTLRIMHEAQLHEENQFLTLTYKEAPPTLNHDHFSAFIKRLRASIYPKKISYYMCGEYGEQTKRPHYHAIIFGHWFPDTKQYNLTKEERWIRMSPTLEKLWGHGYCTTGEVNQTTAAYVARYVVQKINAEGHYDYTDQDGVVHPGVPPYNCMSTRPAIGKQWFDKYEDDLYTFDYAIDHNGNKQRIPTYYDKLRDRKKGDISDIKANRELNAMQYWENNTDARLKVREQVAKAKQRQLKRGN